MANLVSHQGGLSRSRAYYTSVFCGSTVDNSDVLPMSDYTMGSVEASSTESVTSLTLYAATGSSTGTLYELRNEDAGASTLTVAASRITALPSAIAGCDYLAFKADTAATLKLVFKG